MSIHEETRSSPARLSLGQDRERGSPAPVPAPAPVGTNDAEFPKFDDMSFMRIGAILLSLGLASFIFAIEETIVATSVARIGSALNVRGSLAWISTSYMMTNTGLQPIVGRLADIVGAKRLLIIVVWIFIAGNIVCGASNSLELLVAGRLIAGVGGAGILSLAAIIISYLTNEKQRGGYLNLINVVFIVADSLGPILGSTFASAGHGGWRWIFLFCAPLGPIITLILIKALHLPPAPKLTGLREALKHADVLGMALLVASLSFLVVALNLGGQVLVWSSAPIVGMLCASGVSFIAFVVAEGRAEMPVAPLEVFRMWGWRNVPIMIVSRTLLFFHCFSMTFYLPVFLQVTGSPSMLAAALVIPFLMTAAISSAVSLHLAAKLGHVRLVYVGHLVIVPVGFGLLSTLNEKSSLGKVAGYSVLSGWGYGSGTQLTMVIAQNKLPLDILPTVTALISTAPALGGVLGVGILGAVINNVFKSALARSFDVSSVFEGMNLYDVVTLLGRFKEEMGTKEGIVQAYVEAWRKGCWVLAGVAVVQFLLGLGLRRIVLEDGTAKRKAEEGEKSLERSGEGRTATVSSSEQNQTK